MLRYLVITLSALTSCVVICELLRKFEGDKCQWGEATGTCVNIYKCPRGLLYLRAKEHPPICSFNGTEPIICCTDCDFIEDNRKIIVNPDLGMLHLTGQKSHDKCVKFIDELDYECKQKEFTDIDVRTLDPVKNCWPTSSRLPRYFPSIDGNRFLAILGYGGDIDTALWTCSGTIISEKFILTSAYCLYNDIGPVSFVSVNITSDFIPLWQKYMVKKSIPHPEYKPGFNYHDIALIETQNTIAFSKNVLPVCLHSNPDVDNDLGRIFVWKEKDENSSVLDKKTNSYFDTIKCSYFYPPTDYIPDGFNDTIQTCYGDVATPYDSCASDFGSPLVFFANIFEGCADIVLGVMSIPRECTEDLSSGLFTKVIHYVPWIESIVWP